MQENEETAEVFLMTRRQVITAGPKNLPIDISITAVKTVMDLKQVENQFETLGRIINLWRHVEAKK